MEEVGNISSTLKMEAIRSSETSVETQRTTRRNIPEDDTLQSLIFIYIIFKKLVRTAQKTLSSPYRDEVANAV
jgi:hypothetical protein